MRQDARELRRVSRATRPVGQVRMGRGPQVQSFQATALAASVAESDYAAEGAACKQT